MFIKWLLTCTLASICPLLFAQTSDATIEIEGTKIHPGITVSEALLLFKGKQVSRSDKQLVITRPDRTYQKIIGTLDIENEVVVGVCRPWDYPGETDAELARVLFAAVSGNSKEPSQNAVVETSIERTAKQTIEALLIRIGQRTITITRQEFYDKAPLNNVVSVQECLAKIGWHVGLKD
jgi:hypothetical protein